MTLRIPVSTIQVKWNDAQRVDRGDMNTEQDHKNINDSAIVNNFFGSGVQPASPFQQILFDSDNLTQTQAALVASGDFDGTGLDPHTQPNDSNLGNQLEVELTGTSAFGRLSVKVLIIGLDFQGTPQLDRLYFYKDDKQVTRQHYTQILAIFFNDFKGNTNCSRSLGGRVVIREAASYQLSRDPIMVAQDLEPNLFFRDFKVANPNISSNPSLLLSQTIQEGIGPEYTVDSLNINTNPAATRTITASDVTTKIGQKFKATTNNIQKITLLLGVSRDDSAAIANRFDWAGELVVTVYELQTTVNCPTDIVPELAIEFEPNPQPLAQLSFSQAELRDLGYVLTDVAQPVDFIFSGTQLGSTTNPVIVPDRFYAVTINRAGAANSGTVFTQVGSNLIEDSRLTLFSGVWVDVVEQDLWFQVWTDAGKLADGQAYDAGNGIQIDKTEENELGAEIDFAFKELSFSDSGENILNIGVVQAILDESIEEQDERTGNPVFSRQKFEPEFSFVTQAGLDTLEETTEPLIVGCAQDINPKDNLLIEGEQTFPGLARGDTFIVIEPEPDLLSNNLLGSKLIPNADCASKDYRIFKVLFCTDGYGDINGDGYIDSDDIALATALIGEGLSSLTTQQKIVNGEISTLQLLRADVDGDGYITSNDVDLITNYVARTTNSFPVGSTFNHLEIMLQQSIGRFDGYFDCDGYIRLDGYTGQNIIDPSSLNQFELVYDGYFAPVQLEEDDVFTTVPFPGTDFQILPQPFWQDYLLAFSSEARQVPASFTFSESTSALDCVPDLLFSCDNLADRDPDCEPGRNDIMFPDNIILRRGQILNPDGTHHKIDFEVCTIILQLPEVPLEESVINIFDKFVADRGDGFTNGGIRPCRFADCTTVQPDALARNQVRFDVSIQSINYNVDGYDEDGYGVIVNEGIRAFINHSTGILTLNVTDLTVDPIFMTQITKIQINIFLKKAGFVNNIVVIDPDQVPGLLSA